MSSGDAVEDGREGSTGLEARRRARRDEDVRDDRILETWIDRRDLSSLTEKCQLREKSWMRGALYLPSARNASISSSSLFPTMLSMSKLGSVATKIF